jgi:Spy/CpxP family protein refolding chaperone
LRGLTPSTVAALLVTVAATVAVAAEPSPYAGLERRGVKALSEAEVGDLLAGRGAGMALPAELNRYPGPSHVLELADTLRLSPEQAAETRRLFARMRSEAVPLGEAVVAEEAELDRLFASGTADEASLRSLVAEIARLRGELRLAHLKYHLVTRDLLTPVQVAAYDVARGYGTGAASHGSGGHGGGGMHHPR